MVEALPHTFELDDALKDMIQAVYSAHAAAMAHLHDDEQIVDQALQDCQEVLDTVMDGKVEEWLE